jgi:hypothetical protein
VNLDSLSINSKEIIFDGLFDERGVTSTIFLRIWIAMDVREESQTRRRSPQAKECSRQISREGWIRKHKLIGILSRDLINQSINQSQYFAVF